MANKPLNLPTPISRTSIPLVYFKPRIIFPVVQERSTSEEEMKTKEVDQTSSNAKEAESSISKGSQKENIESNTGIWSEIEHARFLEAMDKYGNDWPSVVQFIGTRTANQVRSHAQKYYRKLKYRAIKKIKNEDNNNKKVFVIVQCYRNKTLISKSYNKKMITQFPLLPSKRKIDPDRKKNITNS